MPVAAGSPPKRAARREVDFEHLRLRDPGHEVPPDNRRREAQQRERRHTSRPSAIGRSPTCTARRRRDAGRQHLFVDRAELRDRRPPHRRAQRVADHARARHRPRSRSRRPRRPTPSGRAASRRCGSASERRSGFATTRYDERQRAHDRHRDEHPGGHRLRRSARTRCDRRGTRCADRHVRRARRRASRGSGSCRRRGARRGDRAPAPADLVSRLPVGSSAHTMRGRFTNARAIATRCCSPPDSSSG